MLDGLSFSRNFIWGLIVVVGLTFWVMMIWGALKGYRWFRAHAESAQGILFDNSDISQHNSAGRVEVVFHTYYGLVAFVTQTEYHFWADPEEALRILWKLHKYNCTWGLLAYGAVVIPLISYANYIMQKRSIRHQLMSEYQRDLT
jgi:hypothetical protein